jgi:GDPmannose 4,6-dehydratase
MRGDNFSVSRKFSVFNIGARFDLSYAYDLVEATLRFSFEAVPADDYIIASGKATYLKDVIVKAFARQGLSWEDHILFHKDEDVPYLIGDSSRLLKYIQIPSTKTAADIIEEMVEYHCLAS